MLAVVQKMHYRRPKFQHYIPRTFARRTARRANPLLEPKLEELCCPLCGHSLLASRFKVRGRFQREVWCKARHCSFGLDSVVTFDQMTRMQ